LLPGRTVGSIFFGGGTPSLMPPATVAAVIAAAEAEWGLATDCEITLEANPNSVEVAKFADLAAAGVNRVSIGVQSFDSQVLEFLGRAHSEGEARRAIATAQEHFARVSFGLIYARPGQSLVAWEAELAGALAFGTDHLSLYQLPIDPGTPFFGLDDLIDLVYARAVPYRMAGSFVMATNAVSKARKLKDSDGQYLWQPSNQAGEPDRLLGYPVFEDPYLAAPASATKSVLFGDMSAYVIKQLPLRVAISTEYLFNTDSVAIKTVYRAGGALPDSAAIAYLVSSNT